MEEGGDMEEERWKKRRRYGGRWKNDGGENEEIWKIFFFYLI